MSPVKRSRKQLKRLLFSVTGRSLLYGAIAFPLPLRIMTVLKSAVVATQKPRICWGCLHKFPSGSILLSEAIADEGSVSNSYLCQDCYHHSHGWGMDEWESTMNGEIGYWKDGTWKPYE